jgi:hypothetical protein
MSRKIFQDAASDTAIRQNGVVILDLLTSADVQSLTSFYQQVEAEHASEFTATVLVQNHNLRRRVHDAVSAVLAKRLLPVLCDYRIVVGSFAVKRGSSKFSAVGMHQDFSFVENEGDEVGISLWCPLVEVNSRNGWLGIVPGSHLLNSQFREPCSLPYPGLVDLIEEKYTTYLAMRPGQVLFMDNRIFHGSPPNTTAHDRIVAAGIAVPRESQLIYCHRDEEGDNGVLEIYRVADEFLLQHTVGERPATGHFLRKVPRVVSELAEADLAVGALAGA